MSTRTLRWGILGAARVNERLLPAIVEAENAQLVAIASRRPQAAAETLARYAPGLQGVQVHDTLESLIADPEVEALYVPLANEEHTPWVLQAIAHGKHVLVEKPMAIRSADIATIAKAAQRQGVVVMEGFMYRFHPQFDRAQEILRSGVIGDLKFVRTSYSFIMRPARMYRISRGVNDGGGAMWDIGPYAVHSLRMCFGCEPLSVTAMATFNAHGADTATSAILDFGQGRHGHFDIGFEVSRRSEYEVTGSKGGFKCHTVWQLPGDVPVLSWWTEDGRFWEERLAPANHFVREITHFSDCVLKGTAPALSLEDAEANCRVIEAVLASATRGQPVRLDTPVSGASPS